MSSAGDVDSGRSGSPGRARWSCGCLAVVLCVFISAGSLGACALLLSDGREPLLILCTLGIGIASIGFAWWRLRRREDREIERFEHRPRVEGDEFLDAMGVDRSSELAEIALAARAKLADLGCVPPESIRASDRFFPDLEKLPFYDSIDVLEVVFTLEKELDIHVSGDDSAAIAESVMKGTVGDVVEHAVRIYREQHGAKTR